MQTHVFDYNEPRIFLSSTRLVASFSRGAGSFIEIILAVPLFILLLLYYPLLVFALEMLKRKSAKLLSVTRSDYKTLEFKDAKDYLNKIEDTIKSLSSIVDKDVASNSALLRPLIRRANQTLYNFQEMEGIVRGVIYIDTSKESYTAEEKKLFTDLEDFFGDDPESYEKDTFEQLKSQREAV